MSSFPSSYDWPPQQSSSLLDAQLPVEPSQLQVGNNSTAAAMGLGPPLTPAFSQQPASPSPFYSADTSSFMTSSPIAHTSTTSLTFTNDLLQQPPTTPAHFADHTALAFPHTSSNTGASMQAGHMTAGEENGHGTLMVNSYAVAPPQQPPPILQPMQQPPQQQQQQFMHHQISLSGYQPDMQTSPQMHDDRVSSHPSQLPHHLPHHLHQSPSPPPPMSSPHHSYSIQTHQSQQHRDQPLPPLGSPYESSSRLLPLSSHAFPPTIAAQPSSLAMPHSPYSPHTPSNMSQTSGGSNGHNGSVMPHGGMQSSTGQQRPPYVPSQPINMAAPTMTMPNPPMGAMRSSTRGHSHSGSGTVRFNPELMGQSITPPNENAYYAQLMGTSAPTPTAAATPFMSGVPTRTSPPQPVGASQTSPALGRRRSTSQVYSPTTAATIGPNTPKLEATRAASGSSNTVSPSLRPHSGLKRKTSGHALADLSPPRLSEKKEEKSAAAPAPAVTVTAATSTKKGMGRKTKSDVSLLTASERKQRRLQRKAELARVSRRKKKMNLAGMEERVKELQIAIAAAEGRDITGINSPSSGFADLALSGSAASSSGPSSKRVKKEADAEDGEEDGSGGDSEDDEDEEDDEDDGEDDDDEEDAEDERSPRSKIPTSISTPHLARLAATPTNGSPAISPALSRQQSMATMAEETFDLRTFMPAAPVAPQLATDGWMQGLTRPHLPTLHRHAQDTLRTLDQHLRLDSFEKLLRWLVQQATLAESGTPPQTSAAQQAAQAWSFLASQLDLSPAQLSSLTRGYTTHQALQQELESLRQGILQVSGEVRTHVSRVDAFNATLEATIPVSAQQKLTSWLMRNQAWVRAQTSGAAAPVVEPPAPVPVPQEFPSPLPLPLAMPTIPLDPLPMDQLAPLGVGVAEGGFTFSAAPSIAFQTLPSLPQTSELDLPSPPMLPLPPAPATTAATVDPATAAAETIAVTVSHIPSSMGMNLPPVPTIGFDLPTATTMPTTMPMPLPIPMQMPATGTVTDAELMFAEPELHHGS